jgi:hypothetical protein
MLWSLIRNLNTMSLYSRMHGPSLREVKLMMRKVSAAGPPRCSGPVLTADYKYEADTDVQSSAGTRINSSSPSLYRSPSFQRWRDLVVVSPCRASDE